jgi:AraC-like DNA-binding protein
LNYIHAHLHDPELTPTRIAEACRITTRYLHLVFSDQEETVARYILRRRLEECARAAIKRTPKPVGYGHCIRPWIQQPDSFWARLPG